MKVIKNLTQSGSYYLIRNNGEEIKDVSNFLTFLQVKNYSFNTIKNYAYDLKYYFDYLDNIKENHYQIQPQQLIDFIDYLRRYNKNEIAKENIKSGCDHLPSHFAATSMRRILAGVSSFYSWLEITVNGSRNYPTQLKVIDHNVFPILDSYKSFLSFAKKKNQLRSCFLKVKTTKRLPRPVDNEKFLKVIESLHAWRDKSILFLLLQGGGLTPLL